MSGGAGSWQSVASVTITGGGSTDALSGIDHYQHRTSSDAGNTWSSAANGSSVTISSEADSQVEFRAVDGAGNAGGWTAVGASAMARIDRTAPTVPAVSGGSTGGRHGRRDRERERQRRLAVGTGGAGV